MCCTPFSGAEFKYKNCTPRAGSLGIVATNFGVGGWLCRCNSIPKSEATLGSWERWYYRRVVEGVKVIQSNNCQSATNHREMVWHCYRWSTEFIYPSNPKLPVRRRVFNCYNSLLRLIYLNLIKSTSASCPLLRNPKITNTLLVGGLVWRWLQMEHDDNNNINNGKPNDNRNTIWINAFEWAKKHWLWFLWGSMQVIVFLSLDMGFYIINSKMGTIRPKINNNPLEENYLQLNNDAFW